MSQRYFLTAESTYEALRQSLNTALAYPNTFGKSVFQTALYAPRDTFRRVLLAVDTDLPGYSTISSFIAPLLDSDAMEEIDQATYLAALATATAGASNFSSVTDTVTYTNFLPDGGSLATALSGIDSAISARALASDFDQGVKTTDSPEFDALTLTGLSMASGDFAATSANGTFQLAGFGRYIDFETGSIGHSGFAGWVFAGEMDFSSATIIGIDASDVGASALGHAHGAITSDGKVGTTAGLPLITSTGGAIAAGAFGTSSGQFAAGDHTHSQLHDRSHAITSTSDHTAGNWKVFHSNGSGQLVEVALGAANTVLTSNGASSAPTFTAPAVVTKSFVKFTPADNQPPASNYATLDTRNSVLVLEFDAATQESAVFCGVIPESVSVASGLKVSIWWMGDTATSGNVRWGVSFEATGTDMDSDSFDTVTQAHSAASGTSGIETVTTITATAIDSLAAGNRFRLKVTRIADDATNDTMTGDAQLVAVEVQVA